MADYVVLETAVLVSTPLETEILWSWSWTPGPGTVVLVLKDRSRLFSRPINNNLLACL